MKRFKRKRLIEELEGNVQCLRGTEKGISLAPLIIEEGLQGSTSCSWVVHSYLLLCLGPTEGLPEQVLGQNITRHTNKHSSYSNTLGENGSQVL